MIPKASPIFENIVTQLDSPGCQKLTDYCIERKDTLAPIWRGYFAHMLRTKWYAFLLLLVRLLPNILRFLASPSF